MKQENVMVVKMIHRGYCLQTDNVPLVKTEDFNASTDHKQPLKQKNYEEFYLINNIADIAAASGERKMYEKNGI